MRVKLVHPLGRFTSVVYGGAGGFILAQAFAPLSFWPLAFVGLALMLRALWGASFRLGMLSGFVAGLAFYLPHVSWTATYLGPIPWLALTIFESLFWAVAGGLIALAYGSVGRAWSGPVWRYGMLPLIIAALWVARETVTSTWPYGGFAWGRLIQSQSESPLAPWVAWIGFSGGSFLIAFITACALSLALAPWRGLFGALDAWHYWARAALVVGLVALLAAPVWPAQVSGSIAVGAVQGNGKAGYFDKREPGDVLRAQLDATRLLLGQHVDMLVWPEGANDLSPLVRKDVAAALDGVSASFEAPLITNTVTARGTSLYNTSLVWEAERGVTGFYDKAHPVPFGEYVPDRHIWEPLAPGLLGLIKRDYAPGTRPNVLDVAGVRTGFSICFDIVDDELAYRLAADGAQLVIAQTNNADFGRTAENLQQLAIARLRAIELGRSVVNISTVGSSQILGPNGETIASLTPYEPGAMLADTPLATMRTPASHLAGHLQGFISWFGVLALLVFWRPKPRRPHGAAL